MYGISIRILKRTTDNGRNITSILQYKNGKTLEEYGPPIAGELFESMSFPPEKIKMVCEITGNHHSCSRYDYVELKAQKEAGRTVNRMEGD